MRLGCCARAITGQAAAAAAAEQRDELAPFHLVTSIGRRVGVSAMRGQNRTSGCVPFARRRQLFVLSNFRAYEEPAPCSAQRLVHLSGSFRLRSGLQDLRSRIGCVVARRIASWDRRLRCPY